MILTVIIIIIIIIIIIMIITMIITIMMIIIIIIIIKIPNIIKCKSIYRTPTTNTELLVTLHNDPKPLSNIKKSSRKML